ncbi:MAG TPA: hypothetical protein VGO49_06370 [Bradyrhizobium sp.]|nr:hypothetical protein [Bradyrhizobium sp.]
MKGWIGAAALAAMLAGGAPAISPAPAAAANPTLRTESAQITDRTSQRRARRHTHHNHHPSYRATYSGPPHYLGRPIYYAPAPFPLGFDFGFGWW